MRAWVAGVLVALGCAVAAAAPAEIVADTGEGARAVAARDGLEARLLVELNRLRTGHGLAPLRLSRALGAAADAHSRDMGRRGYFGHDGPGGWRFAERMKRWYPQGAARFWSAGENLLWYSPELGADQAVRIWMRSGGHRRNLLSPQWREVGLSAIHVSSAPGAFEDLEVTILTADFGIRR